MDKEFVPKKTITVQLTLDVMAKFEELCEAKNLSKTKMAETLIVEAYGGLHDGTTKD